MFAKSYIPAVTLGFFVLCQSSSVLGGDSLIKILSEVKKEFETGASDISRQRFCTTPATAILAVTTLMDKIGIINLHPRVEAVNRSAQEAATLETGLLLVTKNIAPKSLDGGMNDLGQMTTVIGLTAVDLAAQTPYGKKVCGMAGNALCKIPGVEAGYNYATTWVEPSTLGTIAKGGAVLLCAYLAKK
jgi:hypothetical protein